jgi:nitrogenase-stabilizing/protective protein
MDTVFLQQMNELESAEDFLEFFGIDFDPEVVAVARLHVLQRFHDYLRNRSGATFEDYRASLAKAYDDFVHSDALTEKVFRVHKRAAGIATVPLASIGRVRRTC